MSKTKAHADMEVVKAKDYGQPPPYEDPSSDAEESGKLPAKTKKKEWLDERLIARYEDILIDKASKLYIMPENNSAKLDVKRCEDPAIDGKSRLITEGEPVKKSPEEAIRQLEENIDKKMRKQAKAEKAKCFVRKTRK